MAQLKNNDFEKFQDALSDALSVAELRRLLKFRLNKDLDDISMRSTKQDILFDTLMWIESRDRTLELLAAAREFNPTNEKLLTFAANYQLASTNLNRSSLERIVRDTGLFLDPANFIERLGKVERQVCRIEVRTRQGRTEYGTGFLVGPATIMTNYHVLEKVILGKDNRTTPDGDSAGPENVTVLFDYKMVGQQPVQGVQYELSSQDWLVACRPPCPDDEIAYKSAKKKALPSLEELDYAIFRVKDREPGKERIGGTPDTEAPVRGWVKFDGDLLKELEADPEKVFKPRTALAIMQHPSSGYLKLAFDTQAVLEMNSNKTRVFYSTNTEKGSSGSPCFNLDWKLVALHHLGDPSPDPARYNEGIPINLIVNDLKKQQVYDQLGQ